MTTHLKPLAAALAIVIASPLIASIRAQQAPAAPAPVAPASFAAAPLTRIGVVVRNVKTSAAMYKDILQLDAVPAITNVKIQLPKGTAKVKRAVVTLPNVTLEIDQPDGKSVAMDYLKTHGQGIYRMGFSTPDPIEPKIAALEAKGGKIVAGSKAGMFAWVDMWSPLGTTIDVRQEALSTAKPPVGPQIVDGKAVLSKTALAHLGYASTNTDELAKSYADAFSVKAPNVNQFGPPDFPPNYKSADPATKLRLTTFSRNGPGIELIQSIGASNWTDFVGKHGNHSAPQHLAFPVGDRLKQMVELLQSKGAQWTNGKVGGTYAYLDFTETLGIIFELTGSWKD